MLVTLRGQGVKLELTVMFSIQEVVSLRRNTIIQTTTITLSSLKQISQHGEVAFYKLVVQFSHTANKALFTSMDQRGIARV